MLSLTPCALAVIFSADIYTYPLMVLNIFQESEADIEDFMQQKLDAEEGVGFIIIILSVFDCEFNILYTCIWYMYFVFD